jgi:L-lysine exporter family protein LysE/ArgO
MFSELFAPYLKGLATMASLVVAIGVQNVFVLRQGLERRATFTAATICFLCDVFLVAIGTLGLATLFSASRFLTLLITLGGALFLLIYGARALRAAWKAKGLILNKSKVFSYKKTILTALAVSLLNPHALLDTIVIVGGFSAHYEGAARLACALGAMSASGIWFYSLAYGARYLAPLLSKPKIWRVIDLIIGLMMISLSANLGYDALHVLFE